MNTPQDAYEVVKKSSIKKASAIQIGVVAVFLLAMIYLAVQVTVLSKKVSKISISDQKMEYVHSKVEELVKILDTKDGGMSVDYDPNEQYDFKPGGEQELTAEEPANAQENNEALKEELRSMKDKDKLKVVRDKLVDVYQSSKTRDEELIKVKQSFYDTRALVESWYNDKKGIKPAASESAPAGGDGVFNKLKQGLGHFVQVRKVAGEDLSKPGKKLITIDQIPQLLSYAEILLEAGSLSQAQWVMEDIKTITNQEEILTFSAKVEEFNKKYPNPNADMQSIKELIDIIENQE